MSNLEARPIQQPEFETIPPENTPYSLDITFRHMIDPVLAEMPQDIEKGFKELDAFYEIIRCAITHYDPDATGNDQTPFTD